jgi:hypothetical protein
LSKAIALTYYASALFKLSKQARRQGGWAEFSPAALFIPVGDIISVKMNHPGFCMAKAVGLAV